MYVNPVKRLCMLGLLIQKTFFLNIQMYLPCPSSGTRAGLHKASSTDLAAFNSFTIKISNQFLKSYHFFSCWHYCASTPTDLPSLCNHSTQILSEFHWQDKNWPHKTDPTSRIWMVQTLLYVMVHWSWTQLHPHILPAVHWMCKLFLPSSTFPSLPTFFIFFSALPFKTANLLTGYSSPLNAGTKHRWHWSHRRPSTGECHLKCWHDMEDVLGIFLFSVKFILEDDILNTFQASPRIALKTRKKKKNIWFVCS